MKRFYFIWLLAMAVSFNTKAQKNDPAQFANWFITAKKPDSIGIVAAIDLSKISINDLIRFYGVTAADTNAIKKQLAKPSVDFKFNKIKGVTILTSSDLEKRQAAYEKQFPDAHIGFFKISPPVFLPGGRIWILLEIYCGNMCGNAVSYIYKKTGNTYTLVRSELIWLS
jgi:hypothetical protein